MAMCLPTDTRCRPRLCALSIDVPRWKPRRRVERRRHHQLALTTHRPSPDRTEQNRKHSLRDLPSQVIHPSFHQSPGPSIQLLQIIRIPDRTKLTSPYQREDVKFYPWIDRECPRTAHLFRGRVGWCFCVCYTYLTLYPPETTFIIITIRVAGGRLGEAESDKLASC